MRASRVTVTLVGFTSSRLCLAADGPSFEFALDRLFRRDRAVELDTSQAGGTHIGFENARYRLQQVSESPSAPGMWYVDLPTCMAELARDLGAGRVNQLSDALQRQRGLVEVQA